VILGSEFMPRDSSHKYTMILTVNLYSIKWTAILEVSISNVYVDHGSIFIINTTNMLDLCDVHPNIKPIRTMPIKANDYVRKDGFILYEEGNPLGIG
jgi:hypothetical protein